jgi:uncharacterized protein (DUF305 family)
MKTQLVILTMLCSPAAACEPRVFAKAQAPVADQLDDHEFAHLMAEHHQGGIEMAQLEEKGGASAALKALAARIRRREQSELPHLQAHGKAHDATRILAQHQRVTQANRAALARLRALKGGALDRAFVEEMIKHHQDALMVFDRSHFTNAEDKTLVEKMSVSHRQEIDELKAAALGAVIK